MLMKGLGLTPSVEGLFCTVMLQKPQTDLQSVLSVWDDQPGKLPSNKTYSSSHEEIQSGLHEADNGLTLVFQ